MRKSISHGKPYKINILINVNLNSQDIFSIFVVDFIAELNCLTKYEMYRTYYTVEV